MKILIATLLLGVVCAEKPDLQEFTTGNNLFTAAIYKEAIKESPGNLLISPFSVQTVLALTQSGAKDDTAFEIRSTLHLPNTTEATESAYSALLPTLLGSDKYELHTANKIYVKNSYPLNEPFKKTATDVYKAETENIDFTHKVEAADTINGWVEKQTNNKIRGLIDAKTLDETTRVILINALYFKGKWATPFEWFATAKKDFYKTAKDVVQVETMHNTELYNYYECSILKAKFLELPYQGDDVSMVIVLPNDKEGLPAIESQMEKVFTAPNFTQERVSVSLPKFTIDNKIPLKQILKNLGINKAFTEDSDLSGMAGKKGDLIITDVLQKAFINVTETGTEAAAATAVHVIEESLQLFTQNPKDFVANHPFLFSINYKKISLFIGKVVEPEYDEKIAE